MNLLTNLADKHGSGKGSVDHLYTEIYFNRIKDLRKRTIKLFEIGIWVGSSVRMWLDFFPHIQIYGLDPVPTEMSRRTKWHPRVKNGQSTVNLYEGSQADLKMLEQICSDAKEFDIIIDDGSHAAQDQQKSLAFLFPYLLPGGWYFIEDMRANRKRKLKSIKTSIFLRSIANEQPVSKRCCLSNKQINFLRSKIDCCSVEVDGNSGVIRKKSNIIE